jgi:hypothetical protein
VDDRLIEIHLRSRTDEIAQGRIAEHGDQVVSQRRVRRSIRRRAWIPDAPPDGVGCSGEAGGLGVAAAVPRSAASGPRRHG